MAKKNLMPPEYEQGLTLPNPPPVGEGTNEKGTVRILVAYHTGPYEIGFCGRTWFRGMGQAVTAEELASMQARADFDEFNFIEEK